MRANDKGYVVPLVTDHFAVCLGFSEEEGELRAVIVAPDDEPGSPDLADEGIDCNREHLRELREVIDKTITLLDHLEEGGIVLPWDFDPATN